MAAKKSGPNKSAFIRGVLENNKAASAKDVQDAWNGAGHKGALSPTLFYNIKGKMGLTSGRKKKRRGRPKATAAPSTQSGSDVYLAIEKSLDGLISQAEGV